MSGPPLSGVHSGEELGISSKTPAAFPEDIIRVSNSLQTLQIPHSLSVCVSVFVCTHFNCVIKLLKLGTNCSQVQILQDKMMVFFSSLLSDVPILPLFYTSLTHPQFMCYPAPQTSSFPALFQSAYSSPSLPQASSITTYDHPYCFLKRPSTVGQVLGRDDSLSLYV